MPAWLKRPFVITCPNLKAEVEEADAAAKDAEATAKRAGPSTKASADLYAAALRELANNIRSNVPEELRSYGIVACGAALGDTDFQKDFILQKQHEICGDILNDKPGVIASVAADLAEDSAHAASTAIYYSLQCRIDYILETHLPSLTREFAKAVDKALGEAYHLVFDVDILSPEGQIDGEDDPAFISDLAGLKVSAGGCGYRRTELRGVFLNAMSSALPQMMGDDNEDGLWPSLAPVLGPNSFKKANSTTRWSTFFASDSEWAAEMKLEIERIKALRTTSLKSAGYDEADFPKSDAFDAPTEGFGYGLSKLQRTLFDEIRKFDAEGLLLRASRLQADDQRKLAFEQSRTDKFSNTLFSSMPNKEIKMRNAEFTTAVQNKLGVPLSRLKHIVNRPIKTSAKGETPRVDPFGNNLKKLKGAKNGGTTRNHNSFVDCISNQLFGAALPHKGGNKGKPRSCKGLFTHISLQLDASDEADAKSKYEVLEKIIPDIVLDGRFVSSSIGGNFVNRESILDVKTKSCDAKYPAAASEVGAVVNKLAVDIDHKYHKRARDLDSKLGTPDGAKGPFERELDSYGLNGKVVVPVVGAFAEMSTDVHSIADFIALVQAEKYCSFYNESLADAKGMLMQRLYRTLGLTAHLGWARLLLDRSRDLVDYPNATSNKTRKNNRDPDEDDAHDFDLYHNPDPGHFANSDHADASA
jgi:hypothetical protein